jgi:hypothetical protein
VLQEDWLRSQTLAANGVSFVATEIVHDNDVAGLRRGAKERLHIGEEPGSIDWMPKRLEEKRRKSLPVQPSPLTEAGGDTAAG